MKLLRALAAAIALSNVAATDWNPEPWIKDLVQARAAVQARYANLEWLEQERQIDADALFRRAEAALQRSSSEAEARAILDRLFQRFGDGHVAIRWPSRAAPSPAPSGSPAPAARPADAAAFCKARGYYRPNRASPLAALPGYIPLPEGAFPAGLANVGGVRAGIVRIDYFDVHADAWACEAALGAIGMPIDRPCDEACDNRLLTEAYIRSSAALEARLRALRTAGAEALVVDIGGNGGGSEWAEVAARMLTAKPLRSARLKVMRGPHWQRISADLGERLRGFAAKARGAERARLLDWAAQADAVAREAATPCVAKACDRLVPAGYATGFLASSAAGALRDQPWGVWAFSPAQHLYHDGVWDGPLVVLTDNETWSAAEQFAALLQDNRAAVLIGGRTGGAGCGHSWGGTPTVLDNSKAVLDLPDCVRLRADGSNEVRGVLPDIAVPIRANDGADFKARLIAERLAEAIARARALR
jgi:hypothetical protein